MRRINSKKKDALMVFFCMCCTTFVVHHHHKLPKIKKILFRQQYGIGSLESYNRCYCVIKGDNRRSSNLSDFVSTIRALLTTTKKNN